MINDSFQEWKEQDSLLPLLLCMLLSPCPRASCPVQEHCFHTTATLSCFLCALIVHKPLVPLQLSLIGINLTISFWGLFPLPDTGPAWFSLAVTSLESDFRLIFFIFSPNFHLHSHGLVDFADGEILPLDLKWRYLPVPDYSKMDHSLLWLNSRWLLLWLIWGSKDAEQEDVGVQNL